MQIPENLMRIVGGNISGQRFSFTEMEGDLYYNYISHLSGLLPQQNKFLEIIYSEHFFLNLCVATFFLSIIFMYNM